MRPGRAGEQAADQERERDRGVDVDPHQPRRVGVLRGRAHRPPEPGAGDEQTSAITSGAVARTAKRVTVGDLDPADREQRVLRADQVRDALLGAADPQQADVLEDEREADRGDQRRQLRRVAQRPVAGALDHHVEAAAGDAGDDQRQQQAADQHRRRGRDPEPERGPERERDQRADHEHLAVGEVDQLDDPVDHRVAERDQRPDRAVGDPVDEVVAEPGEVAAGAQVVDAEGDRHRQQQRDQEKRRPARAEREPRADRRRADARGPAEEAGAVSVTRSRSSRRRRARRRRS